MGRAISAAPAASSLAHAAHSPSANARWTPRWTPRWTEMGAEMDAEAAGTALRAFGVTLIDPSRRVEQRHVVRRRASCTAWARSSRCTGTSWAHEIASSGRKIASSAAAPPPRSARLSREALPSRTSCDGLWRGCSRSRGSDAPLRLPSRSCYTTTRTCYPTSSMPHSLGAPCPMRPPQPPLISPRRRAGTAPSRAERASSWALAPPCRAAAAPCCTRVCPRRQLREPDGRWAHGLTSLLFLSLLHQVTPRRPRPASPQACYKPTPSLLAESVRGRPCVSSHLPSPPSPSSPPPPLAISFPPSPVLARSLPLPSHPLASASQVSEVDAA